MDAGGDSQAEPAAAAVERRQRLTSQQATLITKSVNWMRRGDERKVLAHSFIGHAG
jgi:hypothetical protein